MSTDSEGYETSSAYYGRGNNVGCDANDRRIAQIEKAFGSSGQVTDQNTSLKFVRNNSGQQ